MFHKVRGKLELIMIDELMIGTPIESKCVESFSTTALPHLSDCVDATSTVDRLKSTYEAVFGFRSPWREGVLRFIGVGLDGREDVVHSECREIK